MTGFGRGEASDDVATVVVEARSVNHRFLDVKVRLPHALQALEETVRTAFAAHCTRGRIDVHVHLETGSAGVEVVPDRALYDAWVSAVSALAGEALGADGVAAYALRQPGVLTATSVQRDAEELAPLLQAAAAQSAEALAAMRATEGQALAETLEGHFAALETEVDAVTEVVADLGARLQAKLTARIAELVGREVEPWRIAQEAALAADKADVAEELDRLRAHLAHARALVDDDEPAGRKLDFLVQEMLREVNTLGSKAVDHPVRAAVVQGKAILERLREQAANVE